MNKLISIIVVIIFFLAINVFAAGNKAEMKIIKEEKASQLISFSSNVSEEHCKDLQNDQNQALSNARVWISANYKHVRIISHSVTGSYYGRTCAHGFTTVTILYIEK